MSDYRANGNEGIGKDQAVHQLASRQHGAISVAQLRAAGLSKHNVRHRTRTGRLHRLHHGVYAVGHRAISPEGKWMAAVLACGGAKGAYFATGGDFDPDRRIDVLDGWGAAISHRSAAELWRLLPSGDGPVDVSVAGDGGRKKRPGIRLHRRLSLLPAAVTLRGGVPVTTPARTLADLRRVASNRAGAPVSPRDLRRAIRQADVLGLPVGEVGGGDRSRSDLERAFLRLCRRYRLPPPEVNIRVGPDLVDFLWPQRRLVVETDGYRYHRGRAAFEDDRARDLRLRAAGYDVARISEKQLDDEPERVAEVVRAALRVGADA